MEKITNKEQNSVIIKINGIDYDLIWLSNEEFNNLGNNVPCEKFQKDTLIVNNETLDYFHCGEFRNRPKKDIREELKRHYLSEF